MEQEHKRRVRYKGTHPRSYREKYKELNPEKYQADVEKIVQSGDALLAAVLKVAVVGHIDGVGDFAGDGVQLIDLLADAGLRRHKTYRVGVRRVCEYLLGGTLFDNSAGIHDDDVIRHLCDNAEVVRDYHYRGVNLILEVTEQVEYLRLNGNVERRVGLCKYGQHTPRSQGVCRG